MLIDSKVWSTAKLFENFYSYEGDLEITRLPPEVSKILIWSVDLFTEFCLLLSLKENLRLCEFGLWLNLEDGLGEIGGLLLEIKL